MTTLAIVVFWFIVSVVAAQAVLGIGFVRELAKSKPSAHEKCPKVAVVLCLRGADPFLNRCIRALLEQDYPDFEVRIVVDDELDPAWQVVHEILDDVAPSSVTAALLKDAVRTCSLKCSSVAQAIRELDSSFEVVALLDADTIAHPSWLGELVAPLDNPQVGVATGNRWYMPEQPSLGSMVRYCWNAAAVVIMYWCNIAWGGSLAIKRSAIERADLLTHWEKAFCEDTMLFAMLRKHGLRQVFVPSLMMVNRESCSLRGAYHWISRQLLTARLYHPGWLLTVLHCMASVTAPLLALGTLVTAMVLQNHAAMAWSLGGFLLFQAAWIALLIPIEWSLGRIVSSRSEPTRWWTSAAIITMPLAVAMTQLVYPITLLRATFLNTVEWRGIHYEVAGPWNIRFRKRVPYQQRNQKDAVQSL